MDAVELAVFSSRVSAVCEEMGAVLRRTAFSPNIRDRLDFSCAVFDADGALVAQAAHIPVHLGSMAYAMSEVVRRFDWAPGDVVAFNDPFLGGTHLPDVTLVAPLFHEQRLVGFTASRAHHADVGASSPGSMPLSRTLEEEGVIIPPTRIHHAGSAVSEELAGITGATRNPRRSEADLAAQLSSVRSGVRRLGELVERLGLARYTEAIAAINTYAARLVGETLRQVPDGYYTFRDLLDDDGQGCTDLPIQVSIRVSGEQVCVDFAGTAEQTAGNVNCPLPVTAAAVYYVFRCLMPAQTPACAGAFSPILIQAPSGCLLNARRPAAVAAGNVETSTRVVDAVCGALAEAIPDRIPAASHGSMNNVALGGTAAGEAWDYYETIAGGAGASARGPGRSAIHTHMTNTLNTPVEALEMAYPLRIRRYAIRRGSGGSGHHPGGDGVVREYEALAPASGTLITERRRHAPWGRSGGSPGSSGVNALDGTSLPGKTALDLAPGDRFTLESAGGGGWGSEAGTKGAAQGG